jgi:hypothetical protein
MGGKPGGGNPMGDNPIERNRSAMNPTDMAAMMDQGTVRPDMTVKDLIEGVLKVPMDAPATELLQALRRQNQNANPLGKMQNMAREGQPGSGPAPQPPRRGGLDELMQ